MNQQHSGRHWQARRLCRMTLCLALLVSGARLLWRGQPHSVAKGNMTRHNVAPKSSPLKPEKSRTGGIIGWERSPAFGVGEPESEHQSESRLTGGLTADPHTPAREPLLSESQEIREEARRLADLGTAEAFDQFLVLIRRVPQGELKFELGREMAASFKTPELRPLFLKALLTETDDVV